MTSCLPTIWQYQLQEGDPYGRFNCTCYCLAEGLYFDSCGRINTTGQHIRAISNEPIPNRWNPGLSNQQLDLVANKYGVDLDVRVDGWDTLMAILRSGRAVALSVGYRRIAQSHYSGDPSFYGNHEILLLPSHLPAILVYDPLADGRRAGIYKGPGIYPEALLKSSAGDLHYTHGGIRTPLGFGRAYFAAFPTRRLPTSPPPPGVVPGGPIFAGGDMAISEGGLKPYASGFKLHLAKGQPLFQRAGSTDVRTRMSAEGNVNYVGVAATGWYAVQVTTGTRYADGKPRLTVLYVPMTVGKPFAG